MLLLLETTKTNINISANPPVSANVVGDYYADATRRLSIVLLAKEIAGGDGNYTIWIIRQKLSVAPSYIRTHTESSPLTSHMFAPIEVPVQNNDFVRIYLVGLAGDTTTPDTVLEIYDIDAASPTDVNVAIQNLEADLESESEEVAAIWGALTSGLTVVGSIGELLVTDIDAPISSVCSGPGLIPWTITVTTPPPASLPLDGADVWITTDIGGLNIIWQGVTNIFGVVTPMLNSGNYFAWKQLSGYTFNNPEGFTVP